MTNTMFKVAGISRLLSYEELIKLKGKGHIKVRVIDLKTQRNWNTNMKTIVEKFR